MPAAAWRSRGPSWGRTRCPAARGTPCRTAGKQAGTYTGRGRCEQGVGGLLDWGPASGSCSGWEACVWLLQARPVALRRGPAGSGSGACEQRPGLHRLRQPGEGGAGQRAQQKSHQSVTGGHVITAGMPASTPCPACCPHVVLQAVLPLSCTPAWLTEVGVEPHGAPAGRQKLRAGPGGRRVTTENERGERCRRSMRGCAYVMEW